MKFLTPFLAIFFVFMATSCDAEIKGTVVDAVTGQPVEGAVVLVEWTMTKGVPGMSRTESYKVFEAFTDKNGGYNIPRVLNPIVNSPDITIYKKGFVAWNNKLIFPDHKKRTDFNLRDDNIFKLERFRSEYDYNDHQAFIDDVIHVGLAPEKKQQFLKFYRD